MKQFKHYYLAKLNICEYFFYLASDLFNYVAGCSYMILASAFILSLQLYSHYTVETLVEENIDKLMVNCQSFLP